MNTHARRFLLIAVVTLLGLVAAWPPKEKLKLGIDLSGGTILVYEVKPGNRPDFNMDDLIGALKKRVNPEGVQDIPIRKVGSNRIEIILPEADAAEVDEVKRRMTDVGSLEFRILASMKKDKPAIDRAMAANGLNNPPKGYRWAKLGEIVSGKNPKFDATHLTDTAQSWVRNRYSTPTRVRLVGKDKSGKEKIVAVTILGNNSNTLTLDPVRSVLAKDDDSGERTKFTNIGSLTSYFQTIDSYEIDYNPGRMRPSDNAIVREQARGKGFLERFILIKLDRQNVTGESLSYAYPTNDERVQPAVGFHFTPSGGRKFGQLTLDNLPEEGGTFQRHLAILLDNQLMSAPVIRQQITDQGIIENMQAREVDRLISILRAGSLPASLNPSPLLEEKVGATLGQDTIQKGIRAIAISMFVVPIFMIVYYRFAGVVAVVALILNMILLIGAMAFFQASITLPGLAGLALTIGMAVDANVLVFERMREEGERGATMAAQIRSGFNRAWTTIFDSHVTIVLSGIVLYAIGTEEVKGFALTLIIGILINLFTAVYVSRVIFEYWYSKGWLKHLTMMKMFDKSTIDFVSPRKYFMTASLVVITAGLVVTAMRWNRMLNIDFTGGTLVTIQLDPNAPELKGLDATQRTAKVRQLAAQALPEPSVESLSVGNEAGGYRFNIRTTEEAKVDESAPSGVVRNQVQEKILKTFGGILAKLEMAKPGKPEPIPATAKGEVADPNERFPGGWRYTLVFNRPTDPKMIQPKAIEVFKAAGIVNPETRFYLDRPTLPSGAAALPNEQMYLSTDIEPKQAEPLLDNLAKALRDDPNQLFERVEIFGGAVAKDTRTLAILAIVASWLIIVAYLWFQFKSVTYGLAAVLALVHDVLITLCAVAISPYKIDLPMIAAFLTLIGFSVNDTIVIFDRIRELKGKTPVLTGKMVNDALNQTLSRTIITSLTAWLVVVILYLFGGEGLQGFSFCLVVGFLSGTYSTIYIATPILVDWVSKQKAPAVGKPAPALSAR
ncbi:MAG: hypothetical protein JWN86_2406 [Planctomycetota bacterium]|nr:hypothetical protein [Planctomycetota bacterium]